MNILKNFTAKTDTGRNDYQGIFSALMSSLLKPKSLAIMATLIATGGAIAGTMPLPASNANINQADSSAQGIVPANSNIPELQPKLNMPQTTGISADNNSTNITTDESGTNVEINGQQIPTDSDGNVNETVTSEDGTTTSVKVQNNSTDGSSSSSVRVRSSSSSRESSNSTRTESVTGD